MKPFYFMIIVAVLSLLAAFIGKHYTQKYVKPDKTYGYVWTWEPEERQPIARLKGWRDCFVYKVVDGNNTLYISTCGGILNADK